MNNSDNLAVLIDADNAQPTIVDGLLIEVANYGTASVKRIYGDWTEPRLKGWKEILLQYSIQPVQQFAYTTGKNATDSAMIIDAMDLLYTGNFEGFCLVSSDSDFTRLASRIRESGLLVYGFGEQKTPAPFVSACDKFIFTEVLRAKTDESKAIERRTTAQLKQDTKLVTLLRNAVEASSDDDGWAHLGAVGNTIAKQWPEFDPRNYGYASLSRSASESGQLREDEAGQFERQRPDRLDGLVGNGQDRYRKGGIALRYDDENAGVLVLVAWRRREAVGAVAEAFQRRARIVLVAESFHDVLPQRARFVAWIEPQLAAFEFAQRAGASRQGHLLRLEVRRARGDALEIRLGDECTGLQRLLRVRDQGGATAKGEQSHETNSRASRNERYAHNNLRHMPGRQRPPTFAKV